MQDVKRNLQKVKTDGITRFSVLVAFNETYYQRRMIETTMLSDVAYIETTNHAEDVYVPDNLGRIVAAYLANSDWVARYGLSYVQTMKLPYSDWTHMRDTLDEASLNRSSPPNAESETNE